MKIGIIKSCKTKDSFGFIKGQDSAKLIYFKKKSLSDTVKTNDEVIYEEINSEKGTEAINIKLKPTNFNVASLKNIKEDQEDQEKFPSDLPEEYSADLADDDDGSSTSIENSVSDLPSAGV